MPIIAEFYNLLQRTGNKVYTVISELSLEAWVTKEPQSFNYRCNGLYRKLKTGDTWGHLFDCAWMRVYGEISASEITDSFVVLIDIGGEGLIVNHSGEPVCGITNKASSYGVPPDKPGKWVVSLSQVINENIIEFWVDAACNDLFGYVQNGGIITDIHVAKCNVILKSLYYDIETLIDWINPSSQNGKIHPKGICDRDHQTIKPVLFNEIMSTLHSVNETLVSFSLEEILKCKKLTQRIIKKNKKISSLQIVAIGHAHLDIAWMWPIREGRRKAIRTFSTALANIEKYPDYIFGASQYQLFDWIKKDYPHFFERLKKICSGRTFRITGRVMG